MAEGARVKIKNIFDKKKMKELVLLKQQLVFFLSHN